MSPMPSPPARDAHAMAYDSKSNRVILFDGNSIDYQNRPDTWVYELNLTSPHVNNTNPKDHEMNVTLSTDIVITFSESMNQQATEGAIKSLPSITGVFTWNYNATTLTWKPKTNLSSDNEYAVVINRSAKSRLGMNMVNSYKFSFKTGVTPYLIGTEPADKSSNVTPDVNIVMMFSEIMNRSETVNVISSIPSFVGSFVWDITGKIVTWKPISELVSKTKYTVTIANSAESHAGVHIAQTYYFSFTVGIRPYLISTTPMNGSLNVSLNTRITMTFSEVMNRSETEGAISSSPIINGVFTWGMTGKTIILEPISNLEAKTEYTVTISPLARSSIGIRLGSQFAFSFTTKEITYPVVISTIPVNGSTDVDVNSQIVITFSEAMEKNATENAISISSGSITKMEWSNGNRTVTVTASLAPGMMYIVAISTGARDLEGNVMLKTYTFSFTTKQEGTSNTTISVSLLIILIVVLIFIVFFLMRERKRKRIMKKNEVKKRPLTPSSLNKRSKNKD